MNSSDITDLLQTTQTQNSGISQTLSQIMLFVTIFSLIITVLFIVLWIMNWLHRRKVQNAVLDIQATLHEMNERDKTRSSPPPPVAHIPPTPPSAHL